MFLRVVFVTALLWAFALQGAENLPSAKVDGRSEEILRKLSAEISTAKTAEVELHLSAKVQQAQPILPKEALDAQYSLSIERPNKLALLLKEGALGATAVSDGTNAFTYIPTLKVYSVHPAPKDISGIDYESGGPSGDLGSMAFISALFSANPHQSLLAGVKEAAYGGREKIGDSDCDRILFKQDGLDWTLFTSAGEKPQVRRIEVTIPQMRMTMDFTNWKLNNSIPADRFKFAPPEGANNVDAFAED
jgi:hypothetical protein